MNIERVDFMQPIFGAGPGAVTSVAVGKQGVTAVAYNDATGMVSVTSKGKILLVPLTNVRMLYPAAIATPAPAPSVKGK